MISSTLLLDLLVVGTVLAAVLIVFVVLVVRRMRERRRQLVEDIAADKLVRKDRAYNAIRLASAEASVLEREGIDVTAARRMITEGERAMKAGDDFHALSIGRTTQDTLVRLRREGTPTLIARPAVLEPDPTPPDGAEEPTIAPVPSKNPAAARFQIRLLTEEIANAQKQDPGRAGLADAQRFQAEALAALEEEKVTVALGLALKGRRSIGARVESLPPSAPTALPPISFAWAPGVPDPVPRAPAPAAVASRVCPSCGKATKAADLYCRYCGATISSARCPRCQAALEPEDRFCARCGASSGG